MYSEMDCIGWSRVFVENLRMRNIQRFPTKHQWANQMVDHSVLYQWAVRRFVEDLRLRSIRKSSTTPQWKFKRYRLYTVHHWCCLIAWSWFNGWSLNCGIENERTWTSESLIVCFMFFHVCPNWVEVMKGSIAAIWSYLKDMHRLIQFYELPRARFSPTDAIQ